MRELHLFAGIGGGILGGMLLGHECVGAVEINHYCRKVLAARQRDGTLPPFPIHDDIRTFDAKPWRGRIDIVCGGFPCQPWSGAGKRLGTADPRHLWPEMARVISECRPAFVFAENVSMAAFREPWRDLRGLGYRVPPALCLGAVDVGAPHRRNRWWLLAADPDQYRCREAATRCRFIEPWRWKKADGRADADPDQPRLERQDSRVVQERAGECVARPMGPPVPDTDPVREHAVTVDAEVVQAPRRRRLGWWEAEPRVGRVVDGCASRVDRLRALGNAQVPLVAATALQILMEQLR